MYHLYTDGSCLGNPGPGGWAYCLIKDNQCLYQSFGREILTTNNRMELMAAIHALHYFSEHYAHQKVSLYTDSQYVKNGLNQWIHNWKKNQWKTAHKQEVKNKDLWERLDQMNQLVQPEWFWVKGHSDNQWNNYVDALCRAL